MFRPGEEIGSYKLIRQLGRGGFGEVWLAEKRTSLVTKKVAVKLPHEDQVNLEAIRQEAELWEQASGHPNVLPIIDADIYNGQVLIVSEYASGGSLHDRLKQEGKLPVKQAVEMTVGILNGLEFLHNKRILHRDIKPQNILLQGDTPRLADFGISRAMNTTVVSSTVIGTDAYMSPEAFDGKRSVQTDIWSVGVLLYQLLAGGLPFPQPHPSERMFAIVAKEFEPLGDEIPPDLKRIVGRALAKQPAHRYQTTGEMRDDLQKALFGITHPTSAKTEVLKNLPENLPPAATAGGDRRQTRESETETVVNKPLRSPPALTTQAAFQPESIATHFKPAPGAENKPAAAEFQKATDTASGAQTENKPVQYIVGGIAGSILLLLAAIIGVSYSWTASSGSNSSNMNSTVINVELKTFQSVLMSVKVDGKAVTDLKTSADTRNFTAQNNFVIDYSVYQVDKFQLKINGKIIKLSKTPPLGDYYSRFEVNKDNLDQVLQNSSNEQSVIKNNDPASRSTAEMNIELRTTENVYFTGGADERRENFVLSPGEIKKFNPRTVLSIAYYKGFADQVQLKINGKTIETPKQPSGIGGNQIQFKITRDNLDQILQSGKISQ